MPYDRRTYENPEGMRSDIIIPSETQVCRFCSVFSAASAKVDSNKSIQEYAGTGFLLDIRMAKWYNGGITVLD